MGSHTYGFQSGTDKLAAVKEAVRKASADGFLTVGQKYTAEVLETEQHKANNEFVVNITTEGKDGVDASASDSAAHGAVRTPRKHGH